MKNSSAKAKFNSTRQDLAIALNELEDAIKDKIKQRQNSDNIAILHQDNQASEIKIYEQQIQIDNLSSEINNLQQNIADISKENEIIRGVNQALSSRKSQFSQQCRTLIEALEKKLKLIDEIISKS